MPIHVNGIDLSGWQDPVDFSAVRAAGYSFVYAKCTEGAEFVDGTYDRKKQQANAVGLLFGAYHFVDWNASAQSQAELFLANATLGKGDLVPMIDCEGVPGISAARCIATISTISQAIAAAAGRLPAIYLDPDFWKSYLGSTDGFSGHPLWLAQYAKQMQSLGSWEPTFWQFSNTGTVPGVEGDVDLDWFLGDRPALESYRLI